MADLAAYSAYQGLLRLPHKTFAWNWYTKYLGVRDVNGYASGWYDFRYTR
jgi:hypothetical protein